MLSLYIAAVAALARQTPTEWTDLPGGGWNAWLESPGGKLECYMTLRRDEGRTIVEFINATESVAVPTVVWNRAARTLELEFPHYDSRIESTASADGLRLDGEWRKRSGPERWSTLAFHATPAPRQRVPGCVDDEVRYVPNSYDSNLSAYLDSFAGRWSVDFESSDDPAVMTLGTRATGHCVSTIETTLGDYRYLNGRTEHDASFFLSCFDGAHAFLFKAQLAKDGSLSGDFWSGDSWHETWTAVRDDSARLPDPFRLTNFNENVKLDELAFPDLGGKQRKLAEFPGKARVLVAFGSWCPNCNDEAEFLRELDDKYRARGLSIVGLAFELTGNRERDAKQVKIYAERHKLTFPLLVAGTSDKEAASKAFPLLDKVRAYPTTLFVRRDGTVRAVHQGYSGPATGAEHTKLRDDFERLIEELLAESGSGK